VKRHLGQTVIRKKKKKSVKSPARASRLSRAELDEQRINFAYGNAPEGATRWVTRTSLKKAATNRLLVSRKDHVVDR
jgi:hypothetical protein